MKTEIEAGEHVPYDYYEEAKKHAENQGLSVRDSDGKPAVPYFISEERLLKCLVENPSPMIIDRVRVLREDGTRETVMMKPIPKKTD